MSSEQTDKVTIVGKTITAHAKGAVTITATSGQSSASVDVIFTEVSELKVTNQNDLSASWDVVANETRTVGLSFTVDEADKSLNDLGFTVDASHTALELDGLASDPNTVYVASSDADVVTVNGGLVLTAVGAGDASIIIRYESLRQTVSIHVVDSTPVAVSTLSFLDLDDFWRDQWFVGDDPRFVTAEADGPIIEDPDAEYAIVSYDEEVVSVDLDVDTITLEAVGAGRCDVVVSYGDSLSESFEVFVSEHGLSLVDSTFGGELSVGGEQDMSVQIEDVDLESLVIESDDPEVVSVTDQTIHGEKEGETYITITANEKSYLRFSITVVQ